MPTHEWTLARDPYGPGGQRKNKKALIVAAIIMGVVGVIVVLGLLVPAASGEKTPRLGAKSYDAQVDCQVSTVGGTGTVTISGTIKGDSSHYRVTVEVRDAETQQRIAEQTFDVRTNTTFNGTTPARAPAGPAGIECQITKVT
ncbi:hypothetical protein [Actinomadura algeriensis]|uniref:DUF4307 domain-containing protein n=1 Tax=Actinomadura algeriensis TaxID=1679523 RepID=A0ABR9JSE4_9ACTN|nr:hypothetical protein [Actinomadura algeriensis]MBE1533494.1 hypothetical protein [Actinomadura algeriensis]